MMDRTEAHRLVDQLEASAIALANAAKGSIAEARALTLLKTARARAVQALTGAAEGGTPLVPSTADALRTPRTEEQGT